MDDERGPGDGDDYEEGDEGEDGGGAHANRDDTPMTVLFLTRAGCSLCAAVLPIVEREARRRGHALDVVDVDGTEWQDPYGERLPVVVVDGAVVLEGRFGRREVRRALRRK